MARDKNVKLVNACVTKDKYNELVDYANKNTQGNLSYAIRLAIDLLLSKQTKVKTD